jgi:CHASE2 domain-containing sensor protein
MRVSIKIEVVVIGILAGLVACALDASQLFAPLSQEFYRLQFALRGDQPSSPQIVILKIDEESVKEQGKFHWPRSRYVEIVDRLKSLGARAIAFDFSFADATPDDAAFASACLRAGNVFLPVRISHTELGTEYREPPAEIAAAAAGLGHIFLADSSGERVYRVALERGNGPQGYFALSLLVALAGLGIDESEVLPPRATQYRIGPLRVPTGARHEMSVNYAGTGFAQYSCAELYAGRLSAQELQGKLVLVGVQLPNYPAEYQVPTNAPKGAMADILIQANAVDTLLRQRVITPLTIP